MLAVSAADAAGAAVADAADAAAVPAAAGAAVVLAAADAAAVPAAADATLPQLPPLPLPIRTLQQIKQPHHHPKRKQKVHMDMEM